MALLYLTIGQQEDIFDLPGNYLCQPCIDM